MSVKSNGDSTNEENKQIVNSAPKCYVLEKVHENNLHQHPNSNQAQAYIPNANQNLKRKEKKQNKGLRR